MVGLRGDAEGCLCLIIPHSNFSKKLIYIVLKKVLHYYERGAIFF